MDAGYDDRLVKTAGESQNRMIGSQAMTPTLNQNAVALGVPWIAAMSSPGCRFRISGCIHHR